MLLAQTDPVGLPGYDVIAPAKHANGLRKALLSAGSPDGVPVLGHDARELLRIEAGIPLFGRELGEDYNPLEAGLREAISFTKGCYIGQEVIARLNTYHKVQKHLVSMAFQGSVAPPAGARLVVGGQDAGWVTSAIFSPVHGRVLALGYLRPPFVQKGTQVEVEVGNGTLARGEVVRAPQAAQAAEVQPMQSLTGAE
jgi:folate-binding protein YgfZ